MRSMFFFFFSSRRRHTRFDCDWSSDVCSSDLTDRGRGAGGAVVAHPRARHDRRDRDARRRRVSSGGSRARAARGPAALMMPTLRAASVRHLLRHPAQLALALIGLTLGVGTIVAVDVATASSQRAFELSLQAVNGAATHQITGGPRGVDERPRSEEHTSALPSPANLLCRLLL